MKKQQKTVKTTRRRKEVVPTLNTAGKNIRRFLKENGYTDGYQFRYTECMFMDNVKVRHDRKQQVYRIHFRVIYRTARHEAYIDTKWTVPYRYATDTELGKAAERYERYIEDNTTERGSVFTAKRFDGKAFKIRDYEGKGWVLVK
jgi:hypothetical protein